MIVSPLSASNSLALLLQAANGNTFEELRAALHLDDNRAIALEQSYESTQLLERGTRDVNFSARGRIFLQDVLKVNYTFYKTALLKFGTTVYEVDYSNVTAVVDTINSYVRFNTGSTIDDLVPPTAIDSNTKAILVNVVQFKGMWQKPFPKALTRKYKFYNDGTKPVEIDFMVAQHQLNIGSFSRDLQCDVLEMKYVDSSLSFVALLPYERNGLPTLEANLKKSNYTLEKIIYSLKPRNTKVYLPKFKMETGHNFNDLLKKVNVLNVYV